MWIFSTSRIHKQVLFFFHVGFVVVGRICRGHKDDGEALKPLRGHVAHPEGVASLRGPEGRIWPDEF